MTIRSFWNWLDMFVIGVSCATMCFEVYNYFTVGSLLKGMLAEPDKYTDFQNLAKLSQFLILEKAQSISLLKVIEFAGRNRN